VSDITWVRTAEGWLYVAALLDLYSRRIVGWATGASLAAELVLRALPMALRHRRPPAGLL
jgi:putative transposase